MKKRIGVLTGGGDCPGLNAVIRAVVRTAIREYGYDVVGVEEGFEGLLHGRTWPLTLETIRGILPKGGTLLRTTNRGNPFAYKTDPNDPSKVEDLSGIVVDNFKKLALDGLVVIGGDGTLRIADQLCDLGVPVVGVPKTIDNDIAETDYSFGFLTAVAIATEAVDRLHTTAESHNRVMMLEVMGRHVGWIALYAGIAGGADIILIPEISYEMSKIVESIQKRHREGSSFDIIVVAEGATPVGGEPVYQKGSKRLGGVAFQVAEELQKHVDSEVRVTVLGHVQRGGSPISYDRLLSTQYGKRAVDLLADGEFGTMVALKQGEFVPVKIKDAIARMKSVDPSGELVRTARALGISFGDAT